MGARWATAVLSVMVIVTMAVVMAMDVNSKGNSGETNAVSAPQQSAAEDAATRTGVADGLILLAAIGSAVVVNLAVAHRDDSIVDELRHLNELTAASLDDSKSPGSARRRRAPSPSTDDVPY